MWAVGITGILNNKQLLMYMEMKHAQEDIPVFC
jgi:hypothetical protein